MVNKDLGVLHVTWCSGCSAEQATTTVEAFINGQWISLDIGPKCLTKAEEEGKMEE